MTEHTTLKAIVTDALLPCPFCDGPVHYRTEGDVRGCYHIGRPHCPVGRWTMTVEQWNFRTVPNPEASEEAQRLVRQWDDTSAFTTDELYLFTEALIGAVRASSICKGEQ
jgi:hypothetical protein